MHTLKKTLLVCLSIYGIIGVGFLLYGDHERIPMIGLSGLLISIGYLILGLILCIPKESRTVGQGLLLSAGIALVIGISVCSI